MGEEVFNEIKTKSIDSEFYSPIPEGYKKGKTKYVVITGSVISGIGKGTFSSSLAKLLADRGLNVSPIKIEAYLNVDAGTLNPFRHGEVFVLDDGTETDLDLGTYERFLDKNLKEDNFVTSGKIFSEILKKERNGDYLGRDVQLIPHVTGETKKLLRELAMNSKADVVLIEVGGTIGDFENMYVLEAIRELIYEEGKENIVVVNLTYILEPNSLGEQKSKAAQLGIKKMKEMGLSPDVVVCRAENPVTKTVREKISLFSSVPMNRVVDMHDLKEFYKIPLDLRESGIDEEICKLLGLEKFRPKDGGKALKNWSEKMTVEKPKKTVNIGIAGKYTGLRDSYISILKALEHCEAEFNCKIKVKWIETEEIESGKKKVAGALKGIDGVIVPGGFGKRGIEGKIDCARYCREHDIPYLGLCLGFQVTLIDFARNVLGVKEANSKEFDSSCREEVVCLLPEQKKIEGLGGTMRLGGRNIEVKKGTKAFRLYGKTSIRERFRHRFECNPDYIERFEKAGIVFSGKAPKVPIMQILEYNKNKFHFATQFHPEFTSRPLKPNPCFKGFVEACLK